MNLLFASDHRRRSPCGFEGCLLPDGWEPSRLDKRGTPGWGSPYASELLPTGSGCRQGSSDKLARYQTKGGRYMFNFEERLSCISAEDLARTNHQRYIKDVLTVQCSVLKTGTPPIISHYSGLIVVRPGGGFSLLLPNQHVEMSRRRIRETLGPQSDRFDSIFVKL